MKIGFSFIAAIIALAGTNNSFAQKAFPGIDTAHSSLKIGDIVAARFVASPHPNFGSPKPPVSITYPETCAWYGALLFAAATKNETLKQQLIARYEPILGKDSTLIPKPDMVDNTVFGAVPLELYIQTKDLRYLKKGLQIADAQWTLSPKASAASKDFFDKGFTPQTRLWIDDMFMITTVQIQAYRASGNKKYIDRAAKEMVMYLDELQKPNGLFYHAPDVPFFWARGNGWMAAGMTTLLSNLPKKNPDYQRILKGYKIMMLNLKNFQAADGLWAQLIDHPDAWTESSGSAMFTYAMITGVKKGWLKKNDYAPVAAKAWTAVVNRINANGDIEGVCEGTNKKDDMQYYLDRKKLTGDMHGQAPILWSAFALMSL